jgi:hypothetical protein
MICPNCHQDAPPVLRNFRAYCTACGAPMSLAAAPEAVNVAGQPSRVGAGVASVLGWLVLVLGLGAALVVGAIFQAIWPAAIVGWVLGTFIGIPTLLLGFSLIFGGRRLQRAGDERSKGAREQAIFALAARQRGVVTVRDAARALGLREAEADALLTDLARRPDGRVTLEVDDGGGLSYLFHDLLPTSGKRVEVAGPRMRVPQAWQPPRVIDAELIDETEGDHAPPVRHATR